MNPTLRFASSCPDRCDTPYPLQHFDNLAWRQALIKAIFIGAPLWRIHGLDQRLSPELARMALGMNSVASVPSRPSGESSKMFETFIADFPFLLEALINGLLFGGVLALLSLGLNLIFGVVDVIWICYAEIVMFGMYVIFWLNAAGTNGTP